MIAMKRIFVMALVVIGIFAVQMAQVSASEVYIGSQGKTDYYAVGYQKTGKGTWMTENAFAILVKSVTKNPGKKDIVVYDRFDYYPGESPSAGRTWFLSIDKTNGMAMPYWSPLAVKIFNMFKDR